MRRALILVAAALALLAPAAALQGRGRGQGKGKGHEKKAAAVVFAPADRDFLTSHVRSHGLPPGLAKRDDLPPGLEKQLRRNGRLPPGLEKKLAPFPAAIEARLPPCPPDVRRGFLGGIAVMYNSRTGLVIDAFAVLP